MDTSTTLFLCLFAAPFLLCCLLQYGAGRIKTPRLRRALSLPLPLLAGGVFLFSLYKTAVITGWDRLVWDILDGIFGSALAGTGLGWLLGRWQRIQ